MSSLIENYRGFDIRQGLRRRFDAISEGYDASYEDGAWRANGYVFESNTIDDLKKQVDNHIEENADTELTADNLEHARFNPKVDAVDTLRRIATEWLATRKLCTCGKDAACSICEIEHLIDKAFELPEREEVSHE